MPHAELRLLPGQGYGRGDDTRYPHFTTGFESLAPLTLYLMGKYFGRFVSAQHSVPFRQPIHVAQLDYNCAKA